MQAAACGDVVQLQAALRPMSDDPVFLDSCLELLIAEAIPGGHLNILQYLAACKPAGEGLGLFQALC